VAGRARQGGDLNYASPNPVLTAEEDGVGLGDDDEGEGDEEEADDDDQQPEPPRLLPEAPHQLRPLPGLHPCPFLHLLDGPNPRGREACENSRRGSPGAEKETEHRRSQQEAVRLLGQAPLACAAAPVSMCGASDMNHRYFTN